MQLYLDQAQSIGPNSPAAQGMARRRAGAEVPAPRRGTGLNENLAREILELHTVGIGGGYSQADVTEFARALTGLSVAGPRDFDAASPVVFRQVAHEPGDRTVMARRYAQVGKAQAGAILADLAAKPQTARFICGKIARHFVADDPPAAMVATLEAAWMASGRQAAKFKTPNEFVVSSYRALGMQPRGLGQLAVLTTLGQRPFAAPSPKGWPDEAGPWTGSDALVKRLQFAQAMAAAASVPDPNQLAVDTLGARLSAPSANAIRRAESRVEAVALLLMTPEACEKAGVTYATKEELFASADVITIHLVLSDRSRGLVSREDLARMKSTAYLINTARGPIVDEAALLEALQAKKIAGAGIDTYSHEPLPLDSPLRRLDNVVITPHLGYVTAENYKRIYAEMIEGIGGWLNNAPVRQLN
eukprot:gene41356-55938_t